MHSVTGQLDALRRNRKASIKTTKATVKRNLNDKLKVSKAEILAFTCSYARKLHRSMCYRRWLLINKFNARGSGYVLEHRFTKFSEIESNQIY